ncbi:hypothetical protein LUZ63_011697 [Rhynchospora breviuscula]|uniref:Uncharacterized protein n=1 Tax=Rhynchospora breviuscula TaxID=2022672 RepID=A0A9Q0CK96_9POAL|nr:hypothetical protein LUZ63_011697 [Rhynchospora breviuscula]
MEVTSPPLSSPTSKIKFQNPFPSTRESPPLTSTPHLTFPSSSSPSILSMAAGSHISRLPLFLFVLSFISFFLLYNNFHPPPLTSPLRHSSDTSRDLSTSSTSPLLLPSTPSLSVRHILFGIASSSRSIIHRIPLISLWWDPSVRLFVFVDSPPRTRSKRRIEENRFPFPVLVSANASHFPYTFKRGLRSGIRVARIVKELIERTDISKKEVRWIVLGDDDTVFILTNLLETLDKYDWRQWHYIGSRSEMWSQNNDHGFDMAYGGGGIAISLPLAKVLARNIDSCIERYHYLFGSDGRISACLAELGVQITHEHGFHQIDMHGDISGLLSSHPLNPLVSLHHFDQVDPIFPFLNRSASVAHLMTSVRRDPRRALQKTVCYDRPRNRTVSIAWGYSISVFEGNKLLLDLLAVDKTFWPWVRGSNGEEVYMFNTRGSRRRDKCKDPAVFYLKNIVSSGSGDKTRIESSYSRYMPGWCLWTASVKNLRLISVRSQRMERFKDKPLRRHCCDVLPSSTEYKMKVDIRECKEGELVAMYT